VWFSIIGSIALLTIIFISVLSVRRDILTKQRTDYVFAILPALLVAFLLSAAYNHSTTINKQARQRLYSRAADHAAVTSTLIETARIMKLSGNLNDWRLDFYPTLMKNIERARLANRDCKDLYVFGKREGKIKKLIWATGGVRTDPIGIEKINAMTKHLLSNPNDNYAISPVGYHTLSVVVPIRDWQTDLPIAVLGESLKTTYEERVAQRERVVSLIVPLVISILVIFITLIIRRNKIISKQATTSENRYRVLVNSSPNIVLLMDSYAKILQINPAGQKILGITDKDILGSVFTNIWPTSEKQKLCISINKVMQGEEVKVESVYLRPDLRRLVLDIHFCLARDAETNSGIVAIINNITDIKEAEKFLRFAQFSVDKAGDAIWWIDSEANITYANEAACSMLGFTQQQLCQSKAHSLDLACPPDKWKDHWFTLREMGTFTYETQHKHIDGRLVPVEVTSNFLKYDGKEYSCPAIRNIAEKKAYEEQLDYLAHHDALTDLPNRLLFGHRLARELRKCCESGKSVAVMFVDLDQFKLVNDTQGHNVGDALLKECAYRLRNCIRDEDTLARMGGDEFTIIVSEILRIDDSLLIAERILEAMRQPFVYADHEFHMSASIGVSTFPKDGENAETLVKNADAAMYFVKENGRDAYCCFTEQLNQAATAKMDMESSLRKALERNEFELYYQPRIDLATDMIVGAEALIRWRHPEWGLVSPGRFIPFAEEHGQIIQISEWVLPTAFYKVKEWQERNFEDIFVSVNLSAKHFTQKGLIELLSKLLCETQLDARYIELELTEGALMSNPDEASSALQEIRNMGFSVSIDDFGTGYSSLSYLKQFPVDALKLDRSFVSEVTTNREDAAIAQAVINIADTLGLRVVAEGVETLEQLSFLKSIGCDEIQGFFISPPVPAEEFEAMLIEQSYSQRKAA